MNIPGAIKPTRLKKRLKNLKHCRWILLVSLSLAWAGLTGNVWAGSVPADKLKGPWESPESITPHSEAPSSLPAWLLNYSIRFFQLYISPVDGARCQMYPTCSGYGRQAVQKHGAGLGFIMAADRLMRDNWGAEQYHHFIIKYDRPYLSDPLEDNDFWL